VVSLVKIQNTALGLMRAPLRIPFKTALRTVTELEEITVQIVNSEGHVGWGSVVPTPAITGDTEEKIRADLALILGYLRRHTVADVWNWSQELPGVAQCSRSALCAVDVALHDLCARSAGQPLWRWLGGQTSRTLFTNMTISVDTPEIMANRAREAVQAGFDALKIKVGLDAELDRKRVLAVRAAVGAKITFRLDANQGWSESEASALIPWFAEHCGPIDFIEQPVKADQIDALARLVQISPVPLVADESAMTITQASQVIEKKAAHALSVKLIKAGGVAQAREILDLAAQHNVPCLMSCMFEVGAGFQAAAHLASIHPAVRWVDLDSAEFLSHLPYSGGAQFKGREIVCSEKPGLDLALPINRT
jgi:L-alanine-DL-glutamate epimerase-like enolase superfamily enzyme